MSEQFESGTFGRRLPRSCFSVSFVRVSSIHAAVAHTPLLLRIERGVVFTHESPCMVYSEDDWSAVATWLGRQLEKWKVQTGTSMMITSWRGEKEAALGATGTRACGSGARAMQATTGTANRVAGEDCVERLVFGRSRERQ